MSTVNAFSYCILNFHPFAPSLPLTVALHKIQARGLLDGARPTEFFSRNSPKESSIARC